MKRKYILAAVLAASVFAGIQACKKSSSGSQTTDDNAFDRKAMLTNVSANIIVPAYTAFKQNTSDLDLAVSAFIGAPDVAKLMALQNAFVIAYKQWQSTSAFEFGPAAQINLGVNVNTYPANIDQINANIKADTYNPQLLANLAAKGLPAIDYLIFGVGIDNASILSQYTTDPNATKRKKYLAALSTELKTEAATVSAGWSSAYQSTFVNASGTDVGSSVGQLLNQLVYDFEILKNFEVGIPAGTQSMGTTFPTKVQAYYSKISVQLALLHLQAIQNIYLGKSSAGDGLGFDDYLVKANAKYLGGSLNDAIKNQFSTATAKLQTLTDPLSDQIKTNPAAVTAAYTELQKLTVLLKTDMTSSLGILITYGDNDGD
ncbi:imelysin family protein [Pedobacter sp. HMWF019]|uniref:imelysin family protein n=1 Tax=Pedobacter sp. HMWF019 TaxID=2056856 RepID=UPI001304D2A7|nr:imelysin family protein [Pedobacter sp. HMWF019]